MGAACNGQSSVFTLGSSYPLKILLVGTQGVGKTYLLYSWQHGVKNITTPIEPTKHFNVAHVSSSSGLVFMIYDLAGDIGFRLRPFLVGTEGVVFLLRKDDEISVEEFKFIQQLSQEKELQKVPFLFVSQGAKTSTVNKLQSHLNGQLWDSVSLRSYDQENVDMVLTSLEKLLKTH